MANFKHFKPLASRSAAGNLSEFIRLCRDDLSVFGIDLDWSDWRWRGRQIGFTKQGSPGRTTNPQHRMDAAFIEFAKAYVRYQQGMKPVEGYKIYQMKVLREIEAALLQVKGNAAIDGLDVSVLDVAATNVEKNHKGQSIYQCGWHLEALSQFVSEKHLIDGDVRNWKSPFPYQESGLVLTGPKAKAKQDKKLPNEEALFAIAEIFANNPQVSRDIFTTCTFAMLMCAPERGSEVLELPADCEVEEADSKGVLRYGWRFYSSKGYEGDIKWIPDVMVPIAKEAVRRIRTMTEESRKLALWIESNPTRPYRHAKCPNEPDDAPLAAEQVIQFLGYKNVSSVVGGSWRLSEKDGAYTLNGLWDLVMKRQPKGLPWLNKEKRIKYGNALFCMQSNLLHNGNATSPVIVWAPTLGILLIDLASKSRHSSFRSIFERHGYKSSTATPLKLTSHQPRHLLNTLANRSGASQELIAKWSGRADMRQNRVYNHMSEFEMVAKLEAHGTTLTLYNEEGGVSQTVPTTYEESYLLPRGASHVTLYGICTHDYAMSPCDKFRDCTNCWEQECIKGDAERLRRIQAKLHQVEFDYAQSKDDIAKRYAGVDRWHESNERTVVRLRQLVEILESPEVPDGAKIRLRDGRDYSHLRRAISNRATNAALNNTPDAGLLSTMVKQLEGAIG